jgi:hypothetical protein
MFKYNLDQIVFINEDNKIIRAKIKGRKYSDYSESLMKTIKEDYKKLYSSRDSRVDLYRKYVYGNKNLQKFTYILEYNGEQSVYSFKEENIYISPEEAIRMVLINSVL